MLISTNLLKRHIKNSENIDWLNIWDKFTISCAEVEEVVEKGKNIKNIIVGEIVSAELVLDKYLYIDISSGSDTHKVICGDTTLKVGDYVPYAQVGAQVGDMTIEAKKFKGYESNGMLCASKELGISDNYDEVMRLDKSYKLGEDVKKYIPIDDIVVEIDNKSLTNRPDLWGHIGIAREVAALTGNELNNYLIYDEDTSDLDKVKVTVEENSGCNRYSSIRMSNITEKVANIEMQVELFYCGMRSISLLVDLTNYLMLELGQPLHAFDGKIKEVNVKRMRDITFKTLDDIDREIKESTLMICNEEKAVAIAGIMGGMDSEVEEDTNEILLEAANFDATDIRVSANRLGLRTEAAIRYEKSLDPNMTVLAIKRFIYLLKEIDNDITVTSDITDVYNNVLNETAVELSFSKLEKYLGSVDSDKVVSILTGLGFEVNVEKEKYVVTVPTYRATKDIEIDVDIIEEISRIYGYDNIKPLPLKLDLKMNNYRSKREFEYKIKYLLANKYNMNEVHTRIWYSTDFLNKYSIEKNDNVTLVGKKDNNVIRDDLVLSLVENIDKSENVNIFEIGSVYKNNEDIKSLSMIKSVNKKDIETGYLSFKSYILSMFVSLFGIKPVLRKIESDKKHLNNDVTLSIKVNDVELGYISVLKGSISSKINSELLYLICDIDFDKLFAIEKKEYIHKANTKYQTNSIMLTIESNDKDNYEKLEDVLNSYKNELILNREYEYKFKKDNRVYYTFNYIVGAEDRTLVKEDINKFIEDINKYLVDNGYSIKG